MTREQAQDEALRLAHEWKAFAKTIKENERFVLTGTQLKGLCASFERIADTMARLCN